MFLIAPLVAFSLQAPATAPVEVPAGVAADIAVDLPRPRSLESMDEAAVSRTARLIRSHLGEEAGSAAEQARPRLVVAS